MKISNFEHLLLNRQAIGCLTKTLPKKEGLSSNGAFKAKQLEAKELRKADRSESDRHEESMRQRAIDQRSRRAEEFQIDPEKYRRDLNYKKHYGTNRYFCRVINVATEKVIREVPPEEQLDRTVQMKAFLQKLYGIS